MLAQFLILLFWVVQTLAGDLIWNISATTNDGKRTILNNVVGKADIAQGKLHAILGPSGSGTPILSLSQYACHNLLYCIRF